MWEDQVLASPHLRPGVSHPPIGASVADPHYGRKFVELHYSDHARARMAERLIDEAEVAEVLASPTTTRPSPDRDDRTVVIGATPAGRVLIVVVAGSDPQIIVTVAERRPAPRR